MRNLTQAGKQHVENIRKFASRAYSQKRITVARLQEIEGVLEQLEPLLDEGKFDEPVPNEKAARTRSARALRAGIPRVQTSSLATRLESIARDKVPTV